MATNLLVPTSHIPPRVGNLSGARLPTLVRYLQSHLVISLIIEAPEALYSNYTTDFMHLNCQHFIYYIEGEGAHDMNLQNILLSQKGSFQLKLTMDQEM